MSTAIDNCKDAHYYVGIGSMMNPTSLNLRNLNPIESYPVKCINFQRRFWGRMGMAEIFEEDGAEFHAVLHKLSDDDMQALDNMEKGYIRKCIDCYTYDGKHYQATGYQFDRTKLSVDAARPPSERYVDIMCLGMKHYGCSEESILELRSTPDQVPRRNPSEYIKIQVPDECKGTTYTWEQIENCITNSDNDNTTDSNNTLRFVFNGKVIEFIEPIGIDKDIIAARRTRDGVNGGMDITHIPNRMMYEPKYPFCQGVGDMTDEHVAYAEDLWWRNCQAPPTYYKCIGTVQPSRKPK